MLAVWSQCNSTAKWPSLAHQSNTVYISDVVSDMPGKSRIKEPGLKMLSTSSFKDFKTPEGARYCRVIPFSLVTCRCPLKPAVSAVFGPRAEICHIFVKAKLLESDMSM